MKRIIILLKIYIKIKQRDWLSPSKYSNARARRLKLVRLQIKLKHCYQNFYSINKFLLVRLISQCLIVIPFNQIPKIFQSPSLISKLDNSNLAYNSIEIITTFWEKTLLNTIIKDIGFGVKHILIYFTIYLLTLHILKVHLTQFIICREMVERLIKLNKFKDYMEPGSSFINLLMNILMNPWALLFLFLKLEV